MNRNGTTGPIPILDQNANPLLYTLHQHHMNIQPYWIMVLQILALQLFARTLNLCKYGVYLTTLEIGFMRWALKMQVHTLEEVSEKLEEFSENHPHQHLHAIKEELVRELSLHVEKTNRTEKKFFRKIKFSFIEYIIHGFPPLVHSIWYCYIQSSCMSAKDATLWNCYNAFGYRLYNYIFVSYYNFCFVFYVKTIALIAQILRKKNPRIEKRLSFKNLSSIFIMFLYCITWLFPGALMLPYVFTHILPMAFAYMFMIIIYIALWSAIYFFMVYIFAAMPGVKILCCLYLPRSLLQPYYRIAFTLNTIALSIYTFPILLTVLYNYSQYLYYGENYIQTMSNEYNSRDTATYLAIFRNSVNEKLHTLLNFI